MTVFRLYAQVTLEMGSFFRAAYAWSLHHVQGWQPWMVRDHPHNTHPSGTCPQPDFRSHLYRHNDNCPAMPFATASGVQYPL